MSNKARQLALYWLGSAALPIALVPLLLGAAPHAGTVLFVNSCPDSCTFTPGPDDSTTNTSTIPNSTSTLSPFQWSATTFDQVVQCLQQAFEPFDVTVTTTDPGSVPHSELVVAGTSTELGLNAGVGGVAPFTCSFIANAPAFAFANSLGDDPTTICWVGALEAGYMFGLDTDLECTDLMSFAISCGTKSFLDSDMQCGETNPRACCTSSSTQNSFQYLLAQLGPSRVVFTDGFESGNVTQWSASVP